MAPPASVTKQEFEEFKGHIFKKLDRMNNKLDQIFDPEKGHFIQLHDNTKALTAAHKRLDNVEKDLGNGLKSQIQEVEKIAAENAKFVATANKIIWRILTPLFAALGIGLIILILLAMPKVHQTLEILQKVKP